MPIEKEPKRSSGGARWRSPVLLLALIAGLTACVVQSGEIGSSDSQHRLNAAHSFWTQAPLVYPDEYPEFGIHGRGGKLYGWYGIGQSLLLVPADVIGTYLERLPIFDDYRQNETDPTIRNIVVTYTTNTLIGVLSVLVCFRFLLLLDFSVNQAIAGALALLFGTTFLHYTQNMMENNLILLLTLTGFCFQCEWLLSGRKRALLIGSLALGAGVTVRLTTALDIAAVGFFVVTLLVTQSRREGDFGKRIWQYARIAAPCYAAGFFVDRLYQYERFGSWWNTYMAIFAREWRARDAALPASFPWTTPLHTGVLGALFAPQKSIFLFDPLLILALLLAIALWPRLDAAVKAYIASALALVAMYVLFYARYYEWGGNFAWGDRYVSTSVDFVALIAVPLLMRYGSQIRAALRGAGAALVAASVAVQVASVMFWCPLELYQTDPNNRSAWVIAWRFKNIVARMLGKSEAWGLTSPDMTDDKWDYTHITTFNFLPFVLRRVGEAPRWMVGMVLVVWMLLLAALAALLMVLWKRARRGALARLDGRPVGGAQKVLAAEMEAAPAADGV